MGRLVDVDPRLFISGGMSSVITDDYLRTQHIPEHYAGAHQTWSSESIYYNRFAQTGTQTITCYQDLMQPLMRETVLRSPYTHEAYELEYPVALKIGELIPLTGDERLSHQKLMSGVYIPDTITGERIEPQVYVPDVENVITMATAHDVYGGIHYVDVQSWIASAWANDVDLTAGMRM